MSHTMPQVMPDKVKARIKSLRKAGYRFRTWWVGDDGVYRIETDSGHPHLYSASFIWRCPRASG